MAIAALNSTVGGRPGFADTQWGLLVAAGAGENSDQAQETAARLAWEDLYRTYCYPVYAFIRRRGYPRPEAQDLTQDFFVHLLEKKTLTRADPEKGRFRTFLLAALGYFLADAARREGARKRGGGSTFVFLDAVDAAEGDYQMAAPVWQTPERIFEARWATTLIEVALGRLRAEMIAAGRQQQFDVLKDYVAGTEEASYQQTADALGLPPAKLKGIIHRLRNRFGMLVREEIGRTLLDPKEVEAEVRHLLGALRNA